MNGGVKWEADFRAFVKGSDKDQPSCDCTFTVEYDVNTAGTTVIQPRVKPGSVKSLNGGTCAETQRPTPTPTLTVTPTPTPTVTVTP